MYLSAAVYSACTLVLLRAYMYTLVDLPIPSTTALGVYLGTAALGLYLSTDALDTCLSTDALTLYIALSLYLIYVIC